MNSITTYILPQPKQYEPQKGSFSLTGCSRIIITQPELLNSARLLRKSIFEKTGIQIPVTTPQTISTRIDPESLVRSTAPADAENTQNAEKVIVLSTDNTIDENTHFLDITDRQIRILGASGTDVLYGIQSLRQIIAQQGACLSGAHIIDSPDLKNRGFYHDVTRGRIPDLENLKKLADRCSYYKINQLQLYIEHSYLFAGCSEVWRDETPLSPQEIMEFDRYCQSLGIDLIPSISTFGHLYKMLETKTYSDLCELEEAGGNPFSFTKRMAHHTLDASNPQCLPLMKDRIDEFMSLFKSQYFNICADETFDIGRGRTKALCERIGKSQVYIDFVRELCEHVVSRGKIPMFWGDIISEDPEKITQLPKETICLNWGYAPDQNDVSVKALKEAGATQFLCPGVQSWSDFVPLMHDAYDNITRMARYAYEYGAPGILNTEWGDMGHMSHPDFSAFGLILGACLSWNRETPDYEDICKAVSAVEYGDSTGTVMQAFSDISDHCVFGWRYSVIYMEMQLGFIPNTQQYAWAFNYFKKFFGGLKASDVRSANEAIAKNIQSLSMCLGNVPVSAKQVINAYIESAVGQMIFNEMALYLPAKNASHADISAAKQPAAPERTPEYTAAPESASDQVAAPERTPEQTAALLETWFMNYKQTWRQYGKEADLYRLQNVINWYADYLRA